MRRQREKRNESKQANKYYIFVLTGKYDYDKVHNINLINKLKH